jgi:hypothetical protein
MVKVSLGQCPPPPTGGGGGGRNHNLVGDSLVKQCNLTRADE